MNYSHLCTRCGLRVRKADDRGGLWVHVDTRLAHCLDGEGFATPTLAPQQKVTLGFIEDFVRCNGYPPSIRQIADALDVVSTSTAHMHVSALIDKGYLEIGQPRTPRTLRVVKSA